MSTQLSTTLVLRLRAVFAILCGQMAGKPIPGRRRTLLAAAALAGCTPQTDSLGCAINGPREQMPAQVSQVRPGMTQAELEQLLGPADYSPADGLFYFSTGGDCPLEETGRMVSCGLVADFRKDEASGEPAPAPSLQTCWWGGIGE